MPDPLNSSTYQIHFAGVSADEAGVLAASLEEHLRDAVPQRDRLEMDRLRTRADSQDFGATLVLILGTAAVTAVAKGIQAWLTAHTGATIDITDKDGSIVAKNFDAASAAAIAQAWAQRSKG